MLKILIIVTFFAIIMLKILIIVTFFAIIMLKILIIVTFSAIIILKLTIIVTFSAWCTKLEYTAKKTSYSKSLSAVSHVLAGIQPWAMMRGRKQPMAT